MNPSPLRDFILRSMEEDGRRRGSPAVTFSGRIISIPGENIYVRQSFLQWIATTSGFYLPLPPNVFGVVIFPDGTSHNMEGGVHEAPPGFYKLQYVDKHERLDYLSPISEMSTDGEKLILTVILRYRVVDPVIALRIERPVETLMEHVEADVAQYIRTREHTDIADASEHSEDSRLLAFFVQRHNRRFPLSKAFIITGIEIKDFTGDNDYVEMRRKASMESRKNKIEKEQWEYQQELMLLKAQFQAEGEKASAEHRATLAKKAAEHKAEIEKMEAQHEKEKQEILHEVHLLEIELDEKRKRLQMRKDQFSEVVEAISHHFATGTPISTAVMKYLTDFFDAYKEEMDGDAAPSGLGQKSSGGNHNSVPKSSSMGSDKVETLKNTLLDLLNPKK